MRRLENIRKAIQENLWAANWAFREAGEEWKAHLVAFILALGGSIIGVHAPPELGAVVWGN